MTYTIVGSKLWEDYEVCIGIDTMYSGIGVFKTFEKAVEIATNLANNWKREFPKDCVKIEYLPEYFTARELIKEF